MLKQYIESLVRQIDIFSKGLIEINGITKDIEVLNVINGILDELLEEVESDNKRAKREN